MALDAVREGRTAREIALGLYGARRVAEEWESDSAVRSGARYWRDRARATLAAGPPDPWPAA